MIPRSEVYRYVLRAALLPLFLLFLSGCGKTGDAPHHSGPAAKPQDSVAIGSADLHQRPAGEREYNCCIKPACEHCLEKYGKCDCLDRLKRNDPICGECIRGYKAGSGKLKTVNLTTLKQR